MSIFVLKIRRQEMTPIEHELDTSITAGTRPPRSVSAKIFELDNRSNVNSALLATNSRLKQGGAKAGKSRLGS